MLLVEGRDQASGEPKTALNSSFEFLMTFLASIIQPIAVGGGIRTCYRNYGIFDVSLKFTLLIHEQNSASPAILLNIMIGSTLLFCPERG